MTAMLRKLGGILEKARKLEGAMAASVEGAAGRMTGAPTQRPPLEIAHAVVESVARDIQPTGRGQHGFPFNVIRVTLHAPTPRVRAQLQSVLDGPDPLAARIESRLRAAGCSVAGLSVKVTYAAKPRPEWSEPDFHIECSRVDHQDSPDVSPQVRLKLTVLAGTAAASSYVFGAGSVTIGRGAEISNTRGRLVRVNQIAFIDNGDSINQTVSRLHARIDHDLTSGSYRLFDDGSAQGTSVIRQGRGYPVSRGSRGMTLVAGDEVVLGQARLKVATAR